MNEFERMHSKFEGGHDHSDGEREQFGGILEETDEEIFQSYVEDLRLTPDDFDRKILDVGAGSAKFAKWAKEHWVSSSITSLEINPGVLQEKTKGVVGNGEQLPFADGSFDMVISHYSMPHSTPWYQYEGKDPNILKKKVGNIFSEMLRVASGIGEIRLAGVPMGGSDFIHKEMKQFIVEELESLEKKPGVSVEKIHIRDNYRHDENGNKEEELLDSSYLIIIKKNSRDGSKL